MAKPPPIDSRTATDIAKQVQELILEQYALNWQEYKVDPVTGDRQPKGISAALIGVFARYAEIIIQRLNQVPNKNFLAFLDLLGASQLPPQPARVPLLFSLSAGSQVDVIVPQGTQVAAPPAEGEQEPVIFETESDLVVTAAKLELVFVRDPDQDKYAEYSEIADINIDTTEAAIFTGKHPVEHIFYIGHSQLLSFPEIQTLTLTINLSKPMGDDALVQWQVWDGKKWQDQETTETTEMLGAKNLRRQGDNQFSFAAIASVGVSTVNDSASHWLRCVLKTAIADSKIPPQSGKVRSSELPKINSIKLTLNINRTLLKFEAAFTNQLTIDLSKSFFPFGEQPKFGDTFYLANQEAFSKPVATFTLKFKLINPEDLGIDPNIIDQSKKDTKLRLQWEVWDGQIWRGIGISTRTNSNPIDLATAFHDATNAFTDWGENLQVTFTLQASFIPKSTTVNGIENFWIRVRIIAGDYGKGATYKEVPGSYVFTPASFVPPAIESLTVDYSLNTESMPEKIITYNDFVYQQINQGSDRTFAPFEAMKDTKPTVYLGFSLLPNRPLSLFFQVKNSKYGEKSVETVVRQNIVTNEPLKLSWEYWNSKDWINLIVQDDSQNFTRSGLVEFIPPTDIEQSEDFGQSARYWLRIRWESGDYDLEPRLRRILLNTTMASQTVTISNEILGSSDGTQNQTFRTTRSPVLEGEYLEVREPEMPSAMEQESIKKIYGEEGFTVITDVSEQPKEIWVRWCEVPDFYGSGSRDRHYVIDRITGEIRFGDSANGLIPPIGIGNLRLRKYQTGGGTVGNRPANTIVQLKTTVPYVDKVTNPEAATGGANAEIIESLIERAPRTVRHGTRAVTFEDFEDLAMLATPEVARAKCLPLLNLQKNPFDIQNLQYPKAPGEVSVIIVPRSNDAQPLPSLELIKRVQNYLENHAIATAKIWVVGPVYVEVSVTTEIVPTSTDRASTVKADVNKALTDFLHPLTGGFDRLGWTFGRKPHKSDFYALLEAVPGVDHIRSLSINPPEENLPEDIQKIFNTKRFLVYSGRHAINLRVTTA
ncbi:MAG: putative baseplate assembly protein [Nostoc sp.]|uniref:putative baseplate assembly protein n=1 Tax=Nostoc sp. TaxID=1180 RepID=UPI002FFBF752